MKNEEGERAGEERREESESGSGSGSEGEFAVRESWR
jgi:hypothetical protein